MIDHSGLLARPQVESFQSIELSQSVGNCIGIRIWISARWNKLFAKKKQVNILKTYTNQLAATSSSSLL